jgi:uncharacterized RmlC-like cupin family protein
MSLTDRQPPFQQITCAQYATQNAALTKGFERETQHANAQYSHYELGRYENIYIERMAIPEIEPIYTQALQIARQRLGLNKLKIGFWFNAMQPGERTARHNHAESDELLSAVYYLVTPANSGDLVLYAADRTWRISPQAGEFIFFPPELAHEVEENRSQQLRLSVAFNFGVPND